MNSSANTKKSSASPLTILDENEAAASVAYQLAETVAIYLLHAVLVHGRLR